MTVDLELFHSITAKMFADADGLCAATDISGSIVACNLAFGHACGRSTEELETVSVIDALAQSPNSELAHRLDELVDHPEGHATVFIPDPFRSGVISRWRFTIRYYVGLDLVLFWGRDLTEEGRLSQEVRDRTVRDRLTGLANRPALTYEIDQVLKAGQDTALVVLDIDDFTAVNDTYGHKFGDHLLNIVAQRLASAAGIRNTAARVGGDQFAVMIKRYGAAESATTAAERIKSAVCAPLVVDRTPVHLSVSMGLAIARPAASALDLFREADIALSRAKELGGDQLRQFEPDLLKRLKERVRTEVELRTSVRSDQLDADVQGIYSLTSGALTGYEALVRWRHPIRGTVMPLEFLGIAEDCGLLEDVLTAVLNRTLANLHEWLHADPTRSISVNVAPSQLANPKLVAHIADALDQHHVSPAQLTVELTEDQLVEDRLEIRVLHDLHNLGIRLAIDDFGSGASSVGYFWKLPISKLKLDRALITPIATDNKVKIVVESLIAMADRLGFEVVAEGIETQEQLNNLTNLGCSHAQGFFIHRPCPLADAFDAPQQITNPLLANTS